MKRRAKDLIESLSQAAAHAEGRRVKGVRVTKVEIPDVKAIRRPNDRSSKGRTPAQRP